jgi:hypothetical protein
VTKSRANLSRIAFDFNSQRPLFGFDFVICLDLCRA